MGQSSSKNKNKNINSVDTLKEHIFHRNVLMILTNNSHDMFKYFNTHLESNHFFVTCAGKLFEKNTQINYSDENVNPEGGMSIIYYDKYKMSKSKTQKQYNDSIFIYIKIFIEQKCIHDVKNKHFIVTGYDSCDGQYKIKYHPHDMIGKTNTIYLNDKDRIKYDGTINVSTYTNLTKIIGNEPTLKCIIDAINFVLKPNENDVIVDVDINIQNFADIMHRMLNRKNSQLHSFITNNVNTVKNDCDCE